MKYLATLLLAALLPSFYAADALPAARRADWTLTGVPDGDLNSLPFRTTIATTLSPGATSDQIESAFNSAASNTVVKLNAGDYLIDEDIRLTANGVTLRGSTNAAGWPTTRLILTNGGSGFSQAGIELFGGTYPASIFGSVTSRNISSGLTHGSSNITVSTTPTGLAVGWMVVLDQLAGGAVNDAGGFPNRSGRGISQPFMVTAISGNDITIWPPLVGNYWSTSFDPEIFWWDSDVIKWSSIEDIEVDPINDTGVNNARNIFLCNAYACWVRNVKTRRWFTSAGASGFGFAWTVQCEQQDTYVYDAAAVLSSSYGTYTFVAAYNHYAYNISSNVALVHPNISAQACSFMFNICQPPLPYGTASWLPEQWFTHDGYPQYLLYEGNWVHNIFFDDVGDANTANNVVARNRILGFYTGKSGNTIPGVVLNNSPDNSFLGNVLGVEGAHTDILTTTWPEEFFIYAIETAATNTWRTNNYNVVTGGIPSSEALGANTQQDSYRFASADTRFSGYGFAWPFITPVEAIADNADYYTNSPAGYRAFFGEWPPAEAQGSSIAVSGVINSGVKYQ